MSHDALSQFAYHSILAHDHDATCVSAIIKTARAFNAVHGITGVLLFDGERFCQYIEGEPAVLDGLVSRIRQDGRHQNVTTLLHESLAGARRYPDWSMAFCDVDSDAIIDQIIAKPPHEAMAFLKQNHMKLDIG